MELEEAIEKLNYLKTIRDLKDYVKDNNCMLADAIEVALNQLKKQDKMIELMSRFIDTELSSEHLSKVLKIDVKPLETYRENIKQYFEKKVEG